MNIDEKVAIIAIVLGAIGLTMAGCGGGQATAEEIAQHDADVQAQARMTIMPIQCAGCTK
jgi:hypothetical protein